MEKNLQALCNTIIKKAKSENVSISPMKLQKLIFMIFKEYYKKTSKCLFEEKFEAWPYGPVLPSVYYEFSAFKANPIDRLVEDEDNGIYTINMDKNSTVALSINNVWNEYKGYSGTYLSSLTHQPDTAWTKASKANNRYLSLEDIKEEADF